MINLQEKYGKRYKVTMDESWNAESSENRAEWKANGEIAWYYEIKGKRGTLYMQKENACALEMTPQLYEKLKMLVPVVFEWTRDCDEGPTLLIKEPQLEAVVEFIQPRRKRVLSLEQKAHLLAMGEKWRNLAKNTRARDKDGRLIRGFGDVKGNDEAGGQNAPLN